ncbi:MAG: glycosyltransferase family 4 protein [Cyclobacteriaceae bacterium]|nr:glycosyltransferase family 4 protein [Cyclobacteriaceae bacterium]
MKILILHQHFNTPQKGGAIRSYYLAKALADRQMKVIVITAHNEAAYLTENVEGIEVHYLPVPYDNRFGFTARSWSFIKYVKGVLRLAEQFQEVDYCYAISVPLTVGLAAMRIKARYKIPFFFEVGDLWPEAPIQMGFVKNYFFQQALYALEKRIYKSAQTIVALSPAIQATIEKKVPDKQTHLIPNMADCDFYFPESKKPELEVKYDVQGKFVVSYIGAIGVANGLDYFLMCARESRKRNLPVHFLMCGDGAESDRLKQSAHQHELENLTFLQFTNRDGVREIMNVTDASFICYKPISILETGSPNKYFDGLASGKMIIVNFRGWIKEELEKHQCGVYVNPHEPSDFITKIFPVLGDKELQLQMGSNARMLAEKNYSRKKLSHKYCELFNKG